MTSLVILLLATVLYAASSVQGWVGGKGSEAVGKPSCGGATSKHLLAPRDVTINVYNTTDHAGLASTVATSLESHGFLVATIDNDPLGKTIPSLGEIRHGPNGLASAILTAAMLPGAVLVLDDRADASVDLVLGNRFHSLRPPHKGAALKAAKAAGC